MSKRVPASGEANNVTALSHGDLLKEVVDELARRGFEPVLVALRNSAGEVEVLSRKVDVVTFTMWLATIWAPSARDLEPDRARGH